MQESILDVNFEVIVRHFQAAVGWKKIRADPALCFQAANSLTKMMTHALEKCHLHAQGSLMTEEQIAELEAMGPERAAIQYCFSFSQRMDSLMDSDDEVVRSGATFYKMCRTQRVFRNGTRVGDPLVCEQIFSD